MDHRRGLVLAPHPDDEVLGCGGTIARKVRQGTHVSIAFLTDGRGGLAGSPEEVTSLRGRARIAAVSQLSDARRAVKVSILPFVEVKKRALAAHQSQVQAFEAQGAWAREFLAAMNGRYELFFTCH